MRSPVTFAFLDRSRDLCGVGRADRSTQHEYEGGHPRSATRVSVGPNPDRKRANTRRAGGGNCTRVFNYVTICPKCGYDTALSGWPEMGREDESLRGLVANWHRLTSSVRDAIMELLRGG